MKKSPLVAACYSAAEESQREWGSSSEMCKYFDYQGTSFTKWLVEKSRLQLLRPFFLIVPRPLICNLNQLLEDITTYNSINA